MTIEIHRPELEALIQEWMKSGAFQSVEDVLMQALKSAPLPTELFGEASMHIGADLVAAMQASPYREIDLEPPSALAMTQEEFAACYHIPLGTLRGWEQGRSEPDQPAKAYLTVIARDPDGVERALQPVPAL